jgi:hypothetical protein
VGAVLPHVHVSPAPNRLPLHHVDELSMPSVSLSHPHHVPSLPLSMVVVCHNVSRAYCDGHACCLAFFALPFPSMRRRWLCDGSFLLVAPLILPMLATLLIPAGMPPPLIARHLLRPTPQFRSFLCENMDCNLHTSQLVMDAHPHKSTDAMLLLLAVCKRQAVHNGRREVAYAWLGDATLRPSQVRSVTLPP